MSWAGRRRERARAQEATREANDPDDFSDEQFPRLAFGNAELTLFVGQGMPDEATCSAYETTASTFLTQSRRKLQP